MNDNIGELGRAFVVQRTGFGIDFDKEWADMAARLHFMLVDCPEVRYYDNWGLCDRDERLRIRRLARERIGKHIMSGDVSALAKAAEALDVRKPVRPYNMDRYVLREWLQEHVDRWEAQDGCTEAVMEFRKQISDDAMIEAEAQELEEFAAMHSLWAVPPNKLMDLFVNHQQRMHEEGE